MPGPVKNKMFYSIILILCTCLFSQSIPQQDKPVVAVLDLKIAENLADVDKVALSDKLRAEMQRVGRYTVINRSDMVSIMNEHKLEMLGVVTPRQIIEFGDMLKADKIITGSVGKLGTDIIVNLAMTDINSGEIEKSVEEKTPARVEQLFEVMKLLASKISGIELRTINELRLFAEIALSQEEKKRVSFNWNSQMLAISGSNERIRIIQVESGNLLKEVRMRKKVGEIVFHPKRNLLALAADNEVYLFDADAETLNDTFDSKGENIRPICFDNEGNYLAFVQEKKNIVVINLSTKTRFCKLSGQGDEIIFLAYTPQGLLVSLDAKRNLITWDPHSRKRIRQLTVLSDISRIGAADISPNGQVIAIAFKDFKYIGTYSGVEENEYLHLIDLKTGEAINTFEGHEETIQAVAFSQDGQFLASGGKDKTIKIWDLNTGYELTMIKLQASVEELRFSPDGLRLCGGIERTSVALWEVR